VADRGGGGGGLSTEHDPYAALRERDFRLFLAGKLASDMGTQMQSVAVGWEIYERTGLSLHLGYVGLAQILPILVLAVPAGLAADAWNRRRIVIAGQMVLALSSLGLAVVSLRQGGITLLYAFLVLSGCARAFLQPARSALLPQIVSSDHFTSAVTWNVSAFQLSSVLGPALGGFLIALSRSAVPVYLLDAGTAVAFAALLALVRGRAGRAPAVNLAPGGLAAGISFVWRTKVILGAITVDLFAVLLGGATALLPVYAKDILAVGPTGLGWLRAAPALGALLTTFLITHRRPFERAGRALLLSVAAFGIATIVFGLSRSYPLSLAMLFLTGAFDMVSVVVRHTLVQVATPDELRGRVSAVNGVFIGLSNELGGFESGLVAHLLTPTLSVVLGGGGAIVVAAAALALWPELRRYGRLAGPDESR
jgi:MFS family permease